MDKWFRSVIFIAALLLLQGCVLTAPEQPVEVVKPPPVAVKKATPAPVKPVPVKVVPKQINSVAIVLSNNNVSSSLIAQMLQSKLHTDSHIYTLGATPQQQLQTVNTIADSEHTAVVAIGSLAANRVKQIEGKQLVFSQVFNYRAERLLEAGFTGVSMIPSADVLFAEWKKLSPDLERIAIVTGPENKQQIDAIQVAADKHQLTLQYQEVNNDKEMFYAVKQLTPQVQGFWLLPDHRVSSRRGIKDLMSHSMKHGKQLVVFNQTLLKYGGLIYVSVEPDDVTDQLLAQIYHTSDGVRLLNQANIEINDRVAQQLQLLVAQ